MAQVEISNASSGDESEIIQLLKETWLATYPNEEHSITREDIFKKDWGSKERLEKWKKIVSENGKNGIFNFVAKEENKVVGFCQVVKGKDCNELKIIYVLPKHQGKGIGKMLANKAMSLLDFSKDTIVEVVGYNKGAIGFYEGLGFVEFEKGKGHEVPNGKTMSTIRMKLKIKKAVNNIIVDKDCKILIIKRAVRKEKAYPGLWDLPGGGVEEGETLQEAAAREVVEETGLEIKPARDYFYVYHYEDKDLYVYGMISESKNAAVTLSDEHTEFRWISKDEYKNFEYTPSVGATIKEFFK